MKYENVTSTLADAIGYDEGTRTLGVRHHDGSEYHYHPVSKETHQGLMKAKSVGGYLHKNIRGKISHVQVR